MHTSVAPPSPTHRTPPTWRGRATLGMKAGVTLLVLSAVARQADLHAVLHAILAMSPGYFVLAAISFLLIPGLGGLRWWAVLRGMGQECRIATLTALFSTAMVFGQILPSVAG